MQIVNVTELNIADAGYIHSESWKESHKSFCSAEFVAKHTPEAQTEYLRREMAAGKKFSMLIDEYPVGIVSVYGSLIENLYVLPTEWGKGYGTRLLKYALGQCDDVPTLWVLNTNQRAYDLYLRNGFRETGNRKELKLEMYEIEMSADAQTLYELAMKHIYGDGVSEDNDLATKLLTCARDMGHTEATYNLGICYHYGYGTDVDLAKAYELYLESANSGYGKGMELIGRFYNRGIYVEKDRATAEHWLRKAIESGDAEAAEEAEKEYATRRSGMVDWQTLKKIDAHIHILPDAVHEANPDSDDMWVHADLRQYWKMMDSLNIEKAVIMPLNDPWLMSMEFTISAVHQNLYDMKQRYPGKFYAFADVDTRNTPAESVEAIRKAIDEYGLDGIKLHANNTGVVVDSEYNQAIFAFAQERGIPVAIHSYPNSEDDFCAAERIVRVMEQYPSLTVIVSHMGAYQWEKLLLTSAYVDISAILPDYVRSYGIEKTNEILRRFGADRLIFATDYPDNRFLQPDEIYNSYFDILNQMDFTEDEAKMIAYENIERVLNL